MTLQLVELVLGIVLAAGAVYLVLRPILHPEIAGTGTPEAGSDEGDEPEDDSSPRAVALRALTEIEFDRATGKLSDADYDALRARYTVEALAALRGEEGRGMGAGELHAITDATRPASAFPRPPCPVHGPRPETDAAFCSACGRRLGVAPGYCTRCGTALEVDARYCARCGARVAA